MIAVVLPEPVDWWPASSAELTGGDDAAVFAPWASRAALPWVPAPLRAFRRRRALAGATSIPGWQLGELALRGWIRGRTDRRLRGLFGVRDLVDRLAASWIARRRPRAVIAASCAAEHTLAAARRAGARAILVEDLPDLRALHHDLDRAARAHPGCHFLRRFRAPAAIVARQEAERVLADELWVRGAHALDHRLAAGIDAHRVRRWTSAPRVRLARGDARDVLLAGTAAARHGTVEALAAIDAHPDVTLYVHPGEGTEPRDLLDHPRVRRHRGEPVGVVLAPAWCETYPAEVGAAAAAGIPVIATRRAAGFAAIRQVAPGDAEAVTGALREILAGAPAARTGRRCAGSRRYRIRAARSAPSFPGWS